MSYSFIDLAYDVLKQSPKPLTYQEVWQAGLEGGLETARRNRVQQNGGQQLSQTLFF